DDLVLQGEDVFEVAVVALGPEIITARGIEKLDGHPNAAADLAYAAFGHVPDADLAADLLDVGPVAPVREAGVTGDDEQGPEPRQFGDDLARDPVGKIVLRGIAAQIQQRQHRERRLVGRSWRR